MKTTYQRSAELVCDADSGQTTSCETPCALERLARGDDSAMQDLFDRYGRLVWWLALRGTRSATEAEDATQEIFVHLWRNAARFDRTRGSESTFVGVLARRWLSDYRRKALRAAHALAALQEEAQAGTQNYTAQAMDDESDTTAAMALLDGLRTEQQQVLRLAIVQGLSLRAIAQRLDMPIGTVKTISSRAIAKLRQLLPDPQAALE